MFFSTWAALGRVLVIGPLAYVALVLLLRISGKRTLTKLNAFDLVVTVALGSTLATVLLSKSVSLAEGVLALVDPPFPAAQFKGGGERAGQHRHPDAESPPQEDREDDLNPERLQRS